MPFPSCPSRALDPEPRLPPPTLPGPVGAVIAGQGKGRVHPGGREPAPLRALDLSALPRQCPPPALPGPESGSGSPPDLRLQRRHWVLEGHLQTPAQVLQFPPGCSAGSSAASRGTREPWPGREKAGSVRNSLVESIIPKLLLIIRLKTSNFVAPLISFLPLPLFFFLFLPSCQQTRQPVCTKGQF